MTDSRRTSLDPISEANRVRDLVDEAVDRLGAQHQDLAAKLIASFIIRLSGISREVEAWDKQAVGRSRLLELQEQYSRRLEIILERPVLLPPLEPYTPPSLPPVTSQEMDQELALRQLKLVGKRYEATPADDAFNRAPRRDLGGATLVDCRFVDVDFSDYEFDAQTYLVRTRFVRCMFDGIRARGLRGSSLVFEDCSFNHADLRNTSFGYCVFAQGPADEVESRDVKLSGAAFSFCDLRGLRWPQVDLTAASFTECSATNNAWTGAAARQAVFCETSLEGTDLRRANLVEAVFRHCDLRGLQLARAQLNQIDGSQVFNPPGDLPGFDSWDESEDKRHFEAVLEEVRAELERMQAAEADADEGTNVVSFPRREAGGA